MNIIFKTIFGSHLYGTNDENSDKDFKGIFLPEKRDLYLGKLSKSISETTNPNSTKNSADDVETEMYSLHYFIELACKGETVALDMLHAPTNMWIVNSDIWWDIVQNKHLFYTKNLKAFIGYARRQSAKYGTKGSRLNACKEVIGFLSKYQPETRLSIIWDILPTGEHIHFYESPNELHGKVIREYELCGRRVQETVTVKYAISVFKIFYEAYGHRAKEAAENKNIDWKALSHAIRAAYQIKEILIHNTITFPLKEADYLKQVKQGKLDYLTEVAPKLEELIDECEELSVKSSLSDKVNRKFWDDFIVDIYV